MANNPKKVKDPTEVALSAIQEALNIGDTRPPITQPRIRSRRTRRRAIHRAVRASRPFHDARSTRARRTDRPVFDPIDEPRAARRAANDDRETIGQILQAIQKGRPARSVYTLATAVRRRLDCRLRRC